MGVTNKHFVFDFGSVLFEWRPLELVRRVLPQRASDQASAQHWVAQIFQGYGGDWGEFDHGTLSVEQLTRRITARTGLSAHELKALLDAVPHALTPIAPTVRLLAKLRASGQSLFYLSNMPAPFAAHLEQAHDFVAWFVDGVFSSRVQLVKPEAGIFELCTRRFAVEPSQLVLLDDHGPNIKAAQSAGWDVVHFRDAEQAEADLRAAGWWPA
jgi:putative hydrolase of the HAD superfamily